MPSHEVDVVAISLPFLIFAKNLVGDTEIFFELSDPAATSFQFRKIAFGAYPSIDIVSSDGAVYEDVTLSPAGVDTNAYKQFGISGWLGIVTDALLMSVLVKYKIDYKNRTSIDFVRLKQRLISLVDSGNIDCPIPDEDIRKALSVSQDIPSLFKRLLSKF